ncbi:MAG: SDR family NAD(P)-dependent oxidoreductase [Hyphomonadaceae bacterium]|nr:SDR family NAD(P)-dependent oxidoreductase [Hyphomonadaceae bacterium]
MTDASEPLFLIGPGYSARALAELWAGPVFGTFRSDRSRAALQNTRIEPVSISDAYAISRACEHAHLLISAPPDVDGCPALAALGDAVTKAASVTYLSTTGVYGDLQGGWAMEWTPTHPQSDRARRRVLAETAWRDAHFRTRIARLPGIYGPGRSAFDRLRAGTARLIVKPGQVFSRIHIDDIASGVKALILADEIGDFHICDDEAAPPQNVIAYAAHLLGMDPPDAIPIEQADLSPMAQSFYRECKRVANGKLKAATGWRPSYRTYREGLQTILREET